MQFHFSEELRIRCQQLIKKKTGKEISYEQADMYLDAFGKVGMLTLRVIQNNQNKTKQHEKNNST
ncbi:MAG: hypothetical protein ACD_9C00219G0003 [uncultured bacterium]|nr:MAG: hypothetical protein ACD_9C00219G0003 [uncultured bacterium]